MEKEFKIDYIDDKGRTDFIVLRGDDPQEVVDYVKKHVNIKRIKNIKIW